MSKKYLQETFDKFGVNYDNRNNTKTIADWLNEVTKKHKHDMITVRVIPANDQIVVLVEIITK